MPINPLIQSRTLYISHANSLYVTVYLRKGILLCVGTHLVYRRKDSYCTHKEVSGRTYVACSPLYSSVVVSLARTFSDLILCVLIPIMLSWLSIRSKFLTAAILIFNTVKIYVYVCDRS
jgi:hypothetical protein